MINTNHVIKYELNLFFFPIKFSSKNRLILLAYDGSINLWTLITSKKILSFEIDDIVLNFTYSKA